MLAQPTIPLNVFMVHGLVDCKTELLPGINKDSDSEIIDLPKDVS